MMWISASEIVFIIGIGINIKEPVVEDLLHTLALTSERDGSSESSSQHPMPLCDRDENSTILKRVELLMGIVALIW